jgi:PKD repeat protein
MREKRTIGIIVGLIIMTFVGLPTKVEAADFNVIADSPISVVGPGRDVTFDWHLRTDVTQTKIELHTSAGTRVVYTSATQYTWTDFPYGSGWWWVKVFRKGWRKDYKWYGQTSEKPFYHFTAGATEFEWLPGRYDSHGRIVFYELQRDYTIHLPDYFLVPEKLPDCCEDEAAFYRDWASFGLPPSNWDFIRLGDGGLLTIKQGYRWDGASRPCKKYIGNYCPDEYHNFRSTLIHDVMYDLMRMGYLRPDKTSWFPTGHINRKLADMTLYMIAIEDDQPKDDAQSDYFWIRVWGAMRTHDDDMLAGWKYHVSELTAYASDGKAELEWQPADYSGADPRYSEHFNQHLGYQIQRDGIVIATVSPSDTSYTDDTVVYGNTYNYAIRPHPSNTNQDDWSNTAQVAISNVAPTVDAGPDAAINEGDAFTSSGSFMDPGADTWTATVDYGDESGAQSLALADKTFTLSHVYTDNGVYTVTVDVIDSDGDVGTDTVAVTVSNVSPIVDAGDDAAINEGQVFSSSGLFTDPGADTWTATVDYGDESGVQSLALAGKAFTLSHVYADNGVYTVTVTVTDDDGGVGTDTAQVTVNNVAPTVDAGPDAAINEGDAFTSSGSFMDPGADTWTATVDYGDESGVQSLALAGKAFTLSHVYADNGVYTVTVTVTDDDGGVGTDTAQVTVSNVAPTVSIDSVDQPNPQFILPVVHTLTFNGSFTDPGWLDTHNATWDFGDGTVAAGALAEEQTQPDSTGNTTSQHAYSAPGDYTVTLNITDDDGGVGIDTRVIAVISCEEAIPVVDDCVQNLPDDAFRNNPEKRKNAFSEKLGEVIGLVDAGEYQEAIDKLRNDVRAKADGHVDGNPRNDWITDPEAQEEICTMIDDLIAYLETLL